jgi:hypothetical protein
MNFTFSLLLLLSMTKVLVGQTNEEKEIVNEGRMLYQLEMASWYGTDIFLEKFKDKQKNTGGYFSYINQNRAVCVFFSNAQTPQIIATFTFDSAYNVNTAIINSQEREMTKHEVDLLKIREVALTRLSTDKYFEFYQDMNPNVIPVVDDKGKRVYIVTASKKAGIVVFGNDYLLTFTNDNDLKDQKRLHKNIITLEYKEDNSDARWSMHTHTKETGDLITATDICTLMLYEKYANWGQHYVISDKRVSLWDCKKDKLVIITRKAWDRIYEEQKKRGKQ